VDPVIRDPRPVGDAEVRCRRGEPSPFPQQQEAPSPPCTAVIPFGDEIKKKLSKDWTTRVYCEECGSAIGFVFKDGVWQYGMVL
jgi:hypothetical protein